MDMDIVSYVTYSIDLLMYILLVATSYQLN